MAKFTALVTGLLTGFFLVSLAVCLGCYSRTSASGFDCTIALGTPAGRDHRSCPDGGGDWLDDPLLPRA